MAWGVSACGSAKYLGQALKIQHQETAEIKKSIRAACIVLQIQTRADIQIVLLATQTPLSQHGDHADAELRLWHLDTTKCRRTYSASQNAPHRLTNFTCLHLLPHCPVLSRPILDWSMKPCETHGGVADTLNLHFSQVINPKFANPTILKLEELSWTEILGMIYSLEELSPTGILGQIRIKFRYWTKEFWEMTIKSFHRRLGNLMSMCPTSSQDTLKKCWSHRCMHMGEKKFMSLLKDP